MGSARRESALGQILVSTLTGRAKTHTGMAIPESDDSMPSLSGPHHEGINIFPHLFTVPFNYN